MSWNQHTDTSASAAQSEEAARLRAQFAAYEAALRGSRVAVFTQDSALRYSVVSGPLFGLRAEQVLCRDDATILGGRRYEPIVSIKRQVLADGKPRNAEISTGEGHSLRWYDLHLEPLREPGGKIIGLSGVSVDITERKEGEAHLRLLMRELTHRSKNLLAVIQAMARQTSRHAGSLGRFLTNFDARIQALSASHDLLVQDSWHGASLRELVRSQLGAYTDQTQSQVTVDGPAVMLKPEAAQGLGLALHELAANAAKYGALSVPDGAVSISWRELEPDRGLDLVWIEQSGPAVKPRRKRGFGTLVIEHNLVRALNAEVVWTFNPQGVRCEMAIPQAQVAGFR